MENLQFKLIINVWIIKMVSQKTVILKYNYLKINTMKTSTIIFLDISDEADPPDSELKLAIYS